MQGGDGTWYGILGLSVFQQMVNETGNTPYGWGMPSYVFFRDATGAFAQRTSLSPGADVYVRLTGPGANPGSQATDGRVYGHIDATTWGEILQHSTTGFPSFVYFQTATGVFTQRTYLQSGAALYVGPLGCGTYPPCQP